VRLLNRTTRTLSLTAAGGEYYQRAAQILAMVDEAETSAAQESAVPRGTLRVTAATVLGTRHLYRVQVDGPLAGREFDVHTGVSLQGCAT